LVNRYVILQPQEEKPMDIFKITHDCYEASRHWHLPLFAGFITITKAGRREEEVQSFSGSEEVTGDNILPSEILAALKRSASLKW